MLKLKSLLFSLIFCIFVSCGGGESFPEDYQSWYVPGHGTINLNYGQPPSDAIVEYGELSNDIIVLSNVGYSVDYINSNGTTRWRHYTGANCRGLHRWDSDSVSYLNGKNVIILDIDSGTIVDIITPLNISLTDFQATDSGFIAVGNAGIFLLDMLFNITWTNPHAASYSRSAIKAGNTVIVADTFGHRVYGVDITSDEFVFETDEYFPNMVIENNDSVLIVGEHSNRVYNYNNGTRDPLYYCDFYPYNDMYSTVEQIKSMEHDPSGPLLLEPSKPYTSKSICAEDLYSPNGATIADSGELYIASTDNGKVLEIAQSGELRTVVTGFNNPVNIVSIPR